MAPAPVVLVAALLALTAHITFSSTVPAFLWSPHQDGMEKIVEYRTLSPRDLARSAMNRGRWSKYLCSAEKDEETKNFAFLFFGAELQSLDIARPTNADPSLIELLNDSFSNSNFSVAFPYVSAGDENVAIENSMISEFAHTCQHKLGIDSIALVGSCSIDGENVVKLKDIHSIPDYLNSRIEISDGCTDLIVLCSGVSLPMQEYVPQLQDSESSILSQVLNSVKLLGAKYTILYVSDPVRSVKHIPTQGLERFLAEGTKGNESLDSIFCDGVCKIKSSLLEGILVGIVLLVILISGLCCMMGIDTPTRFEVPQDT